MDYLEAAGQEHARQCLARFSGGISDPILKARVKRQSRYWIHALTGKRQIRQLSREDCLVVVQAALDTPPGAVLLACLNNRGTNRHKPARRKRGRYSRSAGKGWMRRGGDV